MIEKLKEARSLAIKLHGEQKYSDKPYEYHLQEVVNILIRFGFSPENEQDLSLLISAWLHDSLEDTNLTKSEIETDFGAEIAEIVWRVTDEEGNNRQERKAKTYLKTRESEQAIILKLADRIANVESCLQTNKGLLKMYKKEQLHFSESLKPFSRSETAIIMWKNLEELLKNE